ncbi:MAG: hypothetical protein OXQ29_06895 [Rhodospirillaceae bacterium]|nr:hypothetical protein [Rhodospirillaceae bacterium]
MLQHVADLNQRVLGERIEPAGPAEYPAPSMSPTAPSSALETPEAWLTMLS